MKFDILTLFPEMIEGFLSESILGRAVKNNIIDIRCTNIRRFANDKHNRVDDYPFGGGLGMVMRPQPVFDTYNFVSKESVNKPYTVYMSPKGKVFNQEMAKKMATKEHIVIICGHYEGIDQRVIDEICDEEISIGDYVLTGGEIAACVICDSVARLVPGVLAESGSFEQESHYNGLLEHPQYTRPRVFNGKNVPEVLLSGHEKNIKEWETEKALELTMEVRPDLCEKQGIEIISKPQPKADANIKVVFAGTDSIKKLETVKMHCDKLKIQNADFVLYENYEKTDCDGIFLVICSECENIRIDEQIPKQMCGYLSDTKNNAEIFNLPIDTDFDITENPFLSASEIANEIFDFSLGSSYAKGENVNLLEHISGKKIGKLTFKSAIPYDLYENHHLKFKNYQKEDVYFAEINTKPENGAVTLFKNGFLCQGEMYGIKSKKYGKIVVFAAKGLGKFIRYALMENKIDSLDFVSGEFGKRAYKTIKIKKDSVLCCSEKTVYQSENPF